MLLYIFYLYLSIFSEYRILWFSYSGIFDWRIFIPLDQGSSYLRIFSPQRLLRFSNCRQPRLSRNGERGSFFAFSDVPVARFLESPNRRFSGICCSRFLPFPESLPKYTQFRDESPFQPLPFYVERGNDDLGPKMLSRWSVDRFSVACFHAFLAVNSSTRIPRTRFGWIRIGKLEATTTRRHHRHRRRRRSLVCKKELSSNRINDPLASIYRARRHGGGTHRRDAQGRTRRTVFEGSGSCFSTSSFCRANPVRGKYYLLSCGAGKFMPSPEV